MDAEAGLTGWLVGACEVFRSGFGVWVRKNLGLLSLAMYGMAWEGCFSVF